MEREILVVTIHVCGICIRKGLVEGHWSLDSLVLGVQHLGDITLELVSLRLNIFDGETYHCAPDLDCHCVLGLESELLLEKDDCSKLGGVIFYIEAILFALDDCVTPTDADVIDPHLTLMASSELELRLLWGHSE